MTYDNKCVNGKITQKSNIDTPELHWQLAMGTVRAHEGLSLLLVYLRTSLDTITVGTTLYRAYLVDAYKKVCKLCTNCYWTQQHVED